MNGSSSLEKLLVAIESVVERENPSRPVALHEPHFEGTKAWPYVKDCLDSRWVSTSGKWVCRFEEEICKCTGAAYAIAVTNGTVALRLALHLVGVKPGEEVLMPPLTFVATANAVAHLGAIPHFVDIEKKSLGLCPEALDNRLSEIGEYKNGRLINKETNRTISAVLPVHVFGHPANVEKLRLVCNRWRLPMVEDAAEAMCSWREVDHSLQHCGLFGEVGTLSFNGNKLITTGGGGALLTNNSDIANRAKHLSTTAKAKHPWDFTHDEVAWNDRLPNLNAALGVAQLEALPSRLEHKRILFNRYKSALDSFDDVVLLEEEKNCKSNYWLITLRFKTPDPQKAKAQRLELLKISHQRGVLLRPAWNLMHHLPMYRSSPYKDLSIAEDQSLRLINLPSSPQLVRQ